MEWINRLNQSIEYIENNLEGEIELEKAAQLAACSLFQYQRMFAYIIEIPLSEYIRRRRMTMAAFELVNGGAKVIDLSLKYGYDSPTAFNRAFQSVHSVSPSKAKIEGIRLTAFPRLTFTLSIKGEKAMNYKVETKEAFRVVGYVTKEQMTMENCFEKVPEFWKQVQEQGGMEKLYSFLNKKESKRILGVSACEKGVFSGYYIAVETDVPVPEGMEEYWVPKSTYAIFECIGTMPEAMQKTQQRIFSEWLPASGYEYASAADIEVYPEGNQQSCDYYSEIWMPITKK